MEIIATIAVVALLFIIVWLKVGETRRKGKYGEFIVNAIVGRFLDKEKYYLITHLTLPTNNGSTQIDHVIVSEYGIFVIETKNMTGWIFGSPFDRTWTQKIYRYSGSFQNPLHQNFKHTKTLQSLLELKAHQIYSVVVFVGDCEFKTPMPENVTYGEECIWFIRSKTKPVLTASEVEEIKHKIAHCRLIPSSKTDRQHAKHVQQIEQR